MEKTYVPLFSEILDKVHKAKTKDKKVAILREHKPDSLKMLLKAAFAPKIEWVFPEGDVPYTPNEAPAGTEHTVLAQESKKIWRFIKGADNVTKQHQKENMFFQMLEGLHESEAKLLVRAKDKKYRVDLLAKKFEGGGHACAAGFNVNVPFEEFYPNLVEKIGEHLEVVKSGGF